jgi:hypothetical protein
MEYRQVTSCIVKINLFQSHDSRKKQPFNQEILTINPLDKHFNFNPNFIFIT